LPVSSSPPSEAAARAAIRFACPGDAGQLARIDIESWAEAYRRIMPAEYIERRRMVRRAASWHHALDRGETVLVAQADRRIVGFGSLQGPEIGMLYLLPVYQGRGIGKLLFRRLLEEIRDAGFDAAFLWVLTNNHRARRFYATQGGHMQYSRPVPGMPPLIEARYRFAVPAEE
jgi:GNAT superfamily N-acetyltransferase